MCFAQMDFFNPVPMGLAIRLSSLHPVISRKKEKKRKEREEGRKEGRKKKIQWSEKKVLLELIYHV